MKKKRHPNPVVSSDLQDEALLELAVAGDAVALEELLVHMAPVMRRRIRSVLALSRSRRGSTSHDTNDVLQQAFLVLIRRGPGVLGSWKRSRGLSVHGFFGMFAERIALSWLKSGRLSGWAECPVAPDTLDTWHAPTPPGALEHRELLEKVWAALAVQLDQVKLQLFCAILVDDEPVRQVCEHFNLTANAVYCARRRFRQLAKAIERRFADPAMACVRSRTALRPGWNGELRFDPGSSVACLE